MIDKDTLDLAMGWVDDLQSNPPTKAVQDQVAAIVRDRTNGQASTEIKTLQHICDILSVMAFNQAKFQGTLIIVEATKLALQAAKKDA